jgi:tRNA G18 (ribose-2'-O)-methylase SpoU
MGQNKKLKLEELNRLDIDGFKKTKKIPLIVVLDNIRSLNNIGSVFRTADSFAIEKIYLCGITACPPHRDIYKTALGAEESVTWEYRKSVLDVVNELQTNGYTVASIEQATNSVELSDVKKLSKLAVVLGNEVKGVQQEVIDASDLCIEIAQYGTKHSLNISVCTGIIIHHFSQLLRN